MYWQTSEGGVIAARKFWAKPPWDEPKVPTCLPSDDDVAYLERSSRG